jgi:hypothetical protein
MTARTSRFAIWCAGPRDAWRATSPHTRGGLRDAGLPIDGETPLPSREVPSDHLPVVIWFEG